MTDNEGPEMARAELARSRAALLSLMGYRKVDEPSGVARMERLPTLRPERETALSLARPVVGRWWTHHPAHDAVELAKPLMEDLARKHPWRFVAFGAGAGVAMVLLKPWKWVPAVAAAGLLLGWSMR
ncbi:hypothetical protein WKW77_16850 [Variovorax ureilyticus]|uniref:DUF1707 domain-containing protein n=1 Tax=Variovorax ureilyticus TaxID=1836198 RepID=A0ABU8VGQ7_9BURK